MAETEFTFESEQILKKQSKRKFIIIAAIIAAAAALVALGIFLIVKSRSNVHRNEEDLPYAYSWKETSEGAIDLTLDQSNAAGYCWTLTAVTSEALTVQAPASQSTKSADFTLSMSGLGVGSATFSLQNTQDPSDRIYEMQFSFEQTADDEGKTTPSLQYVYGRYVFQTLSGGENTEHSYVISESTDGTRYIVCVFDKEQYIPERDIPQYLDPDTGKRMTMTQEEHVRWILDYVKNGKRPASADDDADDSDGEAWWTDPFTGETVTEEEWRRIILENIDEVEEMIAAATGEEEPQPEPLYRMHNDWFAVSSDESVISVEGMGYTGSAPEAVTDTEPEWWVSCTLKRGGNTGSCTVTVRSDTAGAAVVLDIQVAEDRTLTVANHRLETFEPAEKIEGPVEGPEKSAEETGEPEENGTGE